MSAPVLISATRFYAHNGAHFLIRDVVDEDGTFIRCENGTVDGEGEVEWMQCPEGSLFDNLRPISAAK